MALPRLPAAVEHLIVKGACALPAPLQRALAGAPRRIDGQQLASDVQMLLRLRALTGEAAVASDTSPDLVRARNRAETRVAAGRPRPVSEVRDVEIPGPAGAIATRLYRPGAQIAPEAPPRANGKEAAGEPLILYFHGGGWVIGDLDTHDGVCRFLACETGMPVLSVDYRLAPEHPFPAAIEDAHAAFRWVAAQAAALGVDPARIAVAGDSAGGNIAAATALAAHADGGPQPAMQLLFYPVADARSRHRSRDLFAQDYLLTRNDMEWFERHYLSEEKMRSDPRVSLLAVENLAGLPPAYVATAGFDPLRDEGEAYAQRLRSAGNTVALRRHPGLVHGFANMTAISRSARAAMHEAVGALRMGLA